MLVVISSVLYGSAKSYEITGRIFDAQTEKRLSGAVLTVVNPANGDIHGTHVDKNNSNNKESWFLMNFATEDTDSLDLLLRIELPGYKTKALPLHVGRSFPKRTQLEEPVWLINDTSSVTAETYRDRKSVV